MIGLGSGTKCAMTAVVGCSVVRDKIYEKRIIIIILLLSVPTRASK